jgi:hypothetical protein
LRSFAAQRVKQKNLRPQRYQYVAAASWLSQTAVWFGTATYADEVSTTSEHHSPEFYTRLANTNNERQPDRREHGYSILKMAYSKMTASTKTIANRPPKGR